MLRSGYLKILLILFCHCFLYLCSQGQQQDYSLIVHAVDKDSSFRAATLGLKTTFNNKQDLDKYVTDLTQLLASKGFPAAAVDSSWEKEKTTYVHLFAGPRYSWLHLRLAGIDEPTLDAVGYLEKNYQNKQVNFSQLQALQNRLLTQYEKTGYPFASVFLDSIQI